MKLTCSHLQKHVLVLCILRTGGGRGTKRSDAPFSFSTFVGPENQAPTLLPVRRFGTIHTFHLSTPLILNFSVYFPLFSSGWSYCAGIFASDFNLFQLRLSIALAGHELTTMNIQDWRVNTLFKGLIEQCYFFFESVCTYLPVDRITGHTGTSAILCRHSMQWSSTCAWHHIGRSASPRAHIPAAHP